MSDQKPALAPGLRGQASFRVEEQCLASRIGSGDARVFSTPMLVAGIEQAAAAVVKPCLEPGYTTVGTHIDVYHRVASPPGMTITFEATLETISPNGRGLGFRVRARDEGGEIGEGTHERVIVELDRFEARASGRNELKKVIPEQVAINAKSRPQGRLWSWDGAKFD